MLAALYVATGRELPAELQYGGQFNKRLLCYWPDYGEAVIEAEYGLSVVGQMDLADAGDLSILRTPVTEGMWPEAEIVAALLAEVDELEAQEDAASKIR